MAGTERRKGIVAGPDAGPEADAAHPAARPELPEGTLDLYRLAVEMADRISARRGIANSFFLTLNTIVVGVLGATDVGWYLAGAGIMVSLVWWMLLRSYRDLNRAKFRVILAIETDLPLHIYADEWSALQRNASGAAAAAESAGTRLAKFRELGAVERIVPVIFASIYVTELIRQVATYVSR